MSPTTLSAKAEANISILGFCGALVFLYLFGVHGFLRSADLGADFLIFHRAASLFIEGANPWLLMKDGGEPFSYPPHIASVLLAYGAMPVKLALGLHTLLNIVSIGVLAYFANKWFIHITQPLECKLFQAIPLALIIGNPFMAHSVFEGQITLPCCAAAVVSWHFLRGQQFLLSGIFLGLASIKPQVALFYILWLVLRLELRVLAIGGVCAVLLMLPALLDLGPVHAFRSWFASIEGYSQVWINQPGSVYVVGLESFFVAIGITGSGFALKIVSLLCLLALFIYRKHFDHVLTLNAFFVLPLTFIFGHDTGYAAIMMMWGYLVFLAMRPVSIPHIIIAGALCLGFFFPQRFLREIDFAALHHTRTFIVILAFYFCFRWSKKSGDRAPV